MIGSMLVEAFDFSGKAQLLAKAKSYAYRQQIIFFHVPKCGGTSLSHYFRLKYFFSHFRLREETASRVVDASVGDGEAWMQYKRNLCLYHALDGANFVQGHIAYDPDVFAPLKGRASFITLLREPMDRVVSMYYFDKRLNRTKFSEFLDSQRGRIECSVYSRFFGGLPLDAPSPAEAHRDAAIAALADFAVIGLLEHPQLLEKQVRDGLGLTFRLPLRNVGAERQRVDERAKEVEANRDRLRDMCAYDIAIYQAACSRVLGVHANSQAA